MYAGADNLLYVASQVQLPSATLAKCDADTKGKYLWAQTGAVEENWNACRKPGLVETWTLHQMCAASRAGQQLLYQSENLIYALHSSLGILSW